MRTLERVIRNIEAKKKKFKKVCKTQEYDRYPLNLYDREFIKRQGITDGLKLEMIRAKLKNKFRRMSEQSPPKN